MTMTLIEVAAANFRTDYESDQLNSEFMKRLGVGKRYLPARLAISRSLAIRSDPPLLSRDARRGLSIKGDTLFGSDSSLLVWLSLIVQRSEAREICINKLISLVAAHWRRGLMRLDEDWKQSEELQKQFIKRLINVAEIPATDALQSLIPSNVSHLADSSDGEISVLVGEIGEDTSNNEKVHWLLNSKGGSPHSAIMGSSGSGKTVMATAMLRSIRQQINVPLLALDFKGDLAKFTGNNDQSNFASVFSAASVQPPRIPIPLDILSPPDRDEISIDESSQRFRESFSRMGHNLGSRQRDYIHEAAKRALSSSQPCELRHIRDKLLDIYRENDLKEDGLVSTMNDLCRFDLFSPTYTPSEFFAKSWIIELPQKVSSDCRKIITNLLLDSLDQHLSRLGDADLTGAGLRSPRIICMIDEAHRVLGTKLPALSNLIRTSRSYGGVVMLISQSPDDFSGEEDEFLDNMGFVASFKTNAKPNAARRVLGHNVSLTNLQSGECFARIEGTTKRIKSW